MQSLLDNDVLRLANGIAFDSRKVKKGNLFVAIPGAKDDGTRYIQDAISKGAAVIVAKKGAFKDFPKIDSVDYVEVENPRKALAELSAAYYNLPSHSLDVYGVTGTNGKTTVAGLVRDILNGCTKKCGLLSTVEYAWGDHSEPSSRTTPDPVTVQSSLRAMVDAGCCAASMEASSHALDQCRVHGVRFAAAGYTNLSQDHFDYHNGFEDYYLCKRRLFEQMGKDNPNAPAVINIDDEYGQRLYKDCQSFNVKPISYSICGDADITATQIELGADETKFSLTAFGNTAIVRTGLIGRFNISNILCAAGMALATGIQFDKVVAAISTAKPRWGRLEKISSPAGAQIFVDYAHSPDAIEKVLSTLKEVTKGKLTIVFGCGGDRDRTKRPLMAEVSARIADYVVITSDNPRTEDPNAILDDVEAGIKNIATPYIRIIDRRVAIEKALDSSGPGDVILIAGKGHEDYQEINGICHHFDDREVVREIIGIAK